LNRIYELTPSPEESVIPRILLLVHQAVDENFPTAEKAGRQFSKTVFSDELTEQTAGDRSAPPDDGFNLPPPPVLGVGKASPSSAGGDRLAKTKTVSPVIPPPPPAKVGEVRDTIPPSPAQAKPSSPLESWDEVKALEGSAPIPHQREAQDPQDPASGEATLRDRKEGKDRLGIEQHHKKKPPQDDASLGPDWTTRITLALLLAGMLLLGYVVFV
jgi:hypothetical protein